MPDTQLEERLSRLESDLVASPLRISAYSELPCALFRYNPEDEWQFRVELKKLATRVEIRGKRVKLISLAEFLWHAIDEAEGLEPVVQLETLEGWEVAQKQVHLYLSDAEFPNLPKSVAARLAELQPDADLVFLWRAAALSPGMYLLSKLLEELTGRLTIPAVLFYPGVFDESGLRFMGLRDRESTTNYRVKIY
jgi:hypothetical protein